MGNWLISRSSDRHFVRSRGVRLQAKKMHFILRVGDFAAGLSRRVGAGGHRLPRSPLRVWSARTRKLRCQGFTTAQVCRAGSSDPAALWRPQQHTKFDRLPAALPRRAGAGRPRPASAVRKIVAAQTLAPLDDVASRDALGPQMSGGIIACADSRSTRITQDELAAMNRRAGFPAAMGFAET